MLSVAFAVSFNCCRTLREFQDIPELLEAIKKLLQQPAVSVEQLMKLMAECSKEPCRC